LPRTKSAERAARVSEKRRVVNRSIKSATKTHITSAEKLISENKLEPAREAVKKAVSALDRAAKRKVLHPNTAARRKSRLTKKLNKAALVIPEESKKAAKAKS
jgi:small subunit ribosomal protein S20